MPSRKSDARRSDVSDSMMTTSQQDTPATAPPTIGSLGASTSQPSETPSHPPAEPSEKGKGKDKDKERERDHDAITIEDLNLPKSIITRLAKGVLPPNTQIQANAILALSKSATVFISHLSNAANEWTTSGGKKTIMPADVFSALDDIEYGFMREKLEAEFAKFNEIQSTKRSAYRKKVSAAKKAATGGAGGSSAADESVLSTTTAGGAGDASLLANTTTHSATEGDSERKKKKAKVAPGESGRMDVDGEGEGEADASDAETVADEEVEEEEDDGEEEEEEEESEDSGGEGQEGAEDDELEERRGGVEDEALDDDSE